MIAIEGTVVGDLVSISYTPSVIYLSDPLGNVVISSAVYARITPQDDDWHMQVELPDNTQLITARSNQWVYLVEESSAQGIYRYMIPSDQASYTYAASRPRRAQEVSR